MADTPLKLPDTGSDNQKKDTKSEEKEEKKKIFLPPKGVDLPPTEQRENYSGHTFSALNNVLMINLRGAKRNLIKIAESAAREINQIISVAGDKQYTETVRLFDYTLKGEYLREVVVYARISYKNNKMLIFQHENVRKPPSEERTPGGSFGIIISFGSFNKIMQFVENKAKVEGFDSLSGTIDNEF